MPTNPLAVRELLSRGLPTQSLIYFVGRLILLPDAIVLPAAIGISVRTFQRIRDRPKALLSAEQGSKAWKFAEILSRATTLLGSQDDAERWMERPAIGLDRLRPIDLLNTVTGVEIVETLLTRLEYGVYT